VKVPIAADKRIQILTALVEAHDTPDSNGNREPISLFKHSGGHSLHHHAIREEELTDLDEALVNELYAEGLADLDYGEHSIHIRPTALARDVVAQHERVMNLEPKADLGPVLSALAAQAKSDNKLSWPAVRPVLGALRRYWEEAGFSEHGIQIPPIFNTLPDKEVGLFQATIKSLVEGDYIRSSSNLGLAGMPAEVVFTARTQSTLDGWPGAEPDELVENLLAVIAAVSAHEEDPATKKRLQKFGETVRELGVTTAGEVLAKVLMGV
jgi:hypothetical protein